MEQGTCWKMRGNVLYVQMPGEVDHHSSDEIKEQIRRAREIQRIRSLVFDFKDTQFMDSAGIGMLLGRYKELRAAGGSVYVRHVPPRLSRILEMSGIYQIIGDWDERIIEGGE